MKFKNLIETYDKINKKQIEIYGYENYDSFEKNFIISKYYEFNQDIYKLVSFLERSIKKMEKGNIFLVNSTLNSKKIFLRLCYQYVFSKNKNF